MFKRWCEWGKGLGLLLALAFVRDMVVITGSGFKMESMAGAGLESGSLFGSGFGDRDFRLGY